MSKLSLDEYLLPPGDYQVYLDVEKNKELWAQRIAAQHIREGLGHNLTPTAKQAPSPRFVMVSHHRANARGIAEYVTTFKAKVVSETDRGAFVRDVALKPDARPEWFADKFLTSIKG